MKQFIKGCIVAVAFIVASGSAIAGDISVDSIQRHSKQGVISVSSSITSGNVNYRVGSAYAQSDLITFNLTPGAVHSSFSWPNALAFEPTKNADGVSVGANMSIGLLNTSEDKSSATYRVTSVMPSLGFPSGTTVDGIINLGAFSLTASSIAAGEVTITVSSIASNGITLIDTQGTLSATIAQPEDEFGEIIVDTGASEIIDVSKSRKSFVSGNTDQISWRIDNDTNLLNKATVTLTKIELKGDFHGMDATNFSLGENTGTVTYDDVEKILTLTYPSLITADTITITSKENHPLKAQAFSVGGSYHYGVDAVESVGEEIFAGVWGLNGAIINVPYMIYGENITQHLIISNESQQSGDIAIIAFDENGTVLNLGVVDTIEASTVKQIATQVSDALKAQNFTAGKVSLTITVDAPANDITVVAGYNVNNDRAFVNTDQYKGR